MLSARGEPVAWAVTACKDFSGHHHFGDLRVGTLVDWLAVPGWAAALVDRTADSLVRQGADLLVSNQMHSEALEALSAAGFLAGPSNFLLGTSEELTRSLHEGDGGVHLNRGDGDGLIQLA